MTPLRALKLPLTSNLLQNTGMACQEGHLNFVLETLTVERERDPDIFELLGGIYALTF